MAEVAVLGFHCTNPACGALFKMRNPGKPGYFKVKCPACGQPVVVKMPGTPASAPEDVTDKLKNTSATECGHQAHADAPRASAKKAERQPEPPLAPDHSGDGVAEYADYPDGDGFFIGKPSKFSCPHCRAFTFSYQSEKTGRFTFTCPRCKGKVGVRFKAATKYIYPGSKGKSCRLVHLRSFWRKTIYNLPVGEHTIGRVDALKPSTISIPGDSSMSRRSVSVRVTYSDMEGYRYLLRVLSATNPVQYDGRLLSQGEEIYLTPGKKFILGNSSFCLEADAKRPGGFW